MQKNVKQGIMVYDVESGMSVPLSSSSNMQKKTVNADQTNRHGAFLLFLNFIAAISCIFVNKILLKPPISFRLPISITFIGYSSSVFGIEVCRLLGYLEKSPQATDLITGKPIPWSVWFRQQPWVLIITTAGAPIIFNLSLIVFVVVSVGVYQLSKVLVSPSILFFEKLKGAKPLSRQRILCLVIVSIGVAVVTYGDMELNVTGMMVAIFNILIAGSYKVEWGHTCRTQRISSLTLMSRVMPQATCVLFIAAICIEGQQLVSYEFNPYVLLLLFMGGVSAFFTSWTGYMVIAQLSAIAHQLLGQAKTCLILLTGALFFDSPISNIQACGAIVAMSAMIYYSYLSMETASSSLSTKRTNHHELSHNNNSVNNNNINNNSKLGRPRFRKSVSSSNHHPDNVAFII